MAEYILSPFADSGDKTAIPDPVQGDGSVSYTEGWGEDYEKVLGTDANAKAIPRQEMNSLLFNITENIQQYQQFGAPEWYSALASAAGYGIHSRVGHDYSGGGYKVYESIVAANAAEPGSDPTKWRIISDNYGSPVGEVIDFFGFSLPEGFLECDGSAVSRTTYSDLFAAVTDTQDGTTSSGTAIITALTDTSQMRVGMAVEGSGVPASSFIVSVDSATQITINANATANATVPLTFFAVSYVDEQSGTMTSGSAIVTALTDTSAMETGMFVQGSGVPAGAKILTVDSGTQITLDANATFTGTRSLTVVGRGNGDGSTTFSLPNFNNRTSIGRGGRDTTGTVGGIGNKVGQVGGELNHQLTDDELSSHDHQPAKFTYTAFTASAGGTPVRRVDGANSTDNTVTTTVVGANDEHNNVTAANVVKKCIRF